MSCLKRLKDKGYKLTTPRKLVLDQLSQFPLTISEIADKLKKNTIKVDLVSVYRTLELFVGLGIVYAVEFGDGKRRYELIDSKNHHHHLVCQTCGKVENIKLSLEKKMLSEIKSQSAFKVERHSLELFGLCVNCQDNLDKHYYG